MTNFATAAISDSELKEKLNKAYAQSHTLLIAVILLACTTGLLMISLVVSLIRGRKIQRSSHVTYVTPETLERAAKGGGSIISMATK